MKKMLDENKLGRYAVAKWWLLNGSKEYQKQIADNTGRGFVECVDDVLTYIDFNSIDKNAYILIYNDLSFALTREFYDRGYYNLVMLTSSISHKVIASRFERIPNQIIDECFVEKKSPYLGILKIEDVHKIGKNGKELNATEKIITGDEKLKNLDYALVIANAPYGKIGAEITECVIKNINFKEYINLLPFNDYTRVKGLWNYVDTDSIICLGHTFPDAAIVPYGALVTKNPCNTYNEEEFLMQLRPNCLRKFYEANLEKSHYAIDTFVSQPTVRTTDNYSNDKDFLISIRALANGIHNSYCDGTPKEALDRSWNLFKTKSLKDVRNDGYTFGWIRFNTTNEFDNFCKLWYEGEKDGVMHKLLKGLAKQCGSCVIALPKIDWTKSWTWEEIFKKEYGYTDEEWQAVLNYKPIHLA